MVKMNMELKGGEKFIYWLRSNSAYFFTFFLILIPILFFYFSKSIYFTFSSVIAIIAIYSAFYPIIVKPHLKILFMLKSKKDLYIDIFKADPMSLDNLGSCCNLVVAFRPIVYNLGVEGAKECEVMAKVWEGNNEEVTDFLPIMWSRPLITQQKDIRLNEFSKIDIGLEEKVNFLIGQLDTGNKKFKLYIEYSPLSKELELGKHYKGKILVMCANSKINIVELEIDLTNLNNELKEIKIRGEPLNLEKIIEMCNISDNRKAIEMYRKSDNRKSQERPSSNPLNPDLNRELTDDDCNELYGQLASILAKCIIVKDQKLLRKTIK